MAASVILVYTDSVIDFTNLKKVLDFTIVGFFAFSEDEDDDLQYASHDYEVPQQKGLKKFWNRVKWTRDEVIML